MPATVSVLFVCMGNICRSPMAQGVFLQRVREAGLEGRVSADSAGTIDDHEGERPDARALEAARRRGVDIADLRARGLRPEDCRRFDLIVAMDRGNLNRLRRACGDGRDVRLLLDFAPGRPEREVPDPYSGGPDAFEVVLDLIEAGTAGLLEAVRRLLHDEEP